MAQLNNDNINHNHFGAPPAVSVRRRRRVLSAFESLQRTTGLCCPHTPTQPSSADTSSYKWSASADIVVSRARHGLSLIRHRVPFLIPFYWHDVLLLPGIISSWVTRPVSTPLGYLGESFKPHFCNTFEQMRLCSVSAGRQQSWSPNEMRFMCYSSIMCNLLTNTRTSCRTSHHLVCVLVEHIFRRWLWRTEWRLTDECAGRMYFYQETHAWWGFMLFVITVVFAVPAVILQEYSFGSS